MPNELRSMASILRAPLLSRRLFLLAVAGVHLFPAPAGAEEPSSNFCPAPALGAPPFGRLDRTAERLKSRTPIRILAIGSSSTQGVGASSQQAAYPAQLERALLRKLPDQKITVINLGVAGETADLTLVRLQRELDRDPPDLVLWQVGTNDALTSSVAKADFASNIESGVSLIKQHGCDVLIIDQQFFKKVENLDRYEQFVAVLAEVANKRRLDLFSRHHVMKFWDKTLVGGVDSMLSKDGFHMNDHGYACLAGLLADHILQITSSSPQ